MLSRRRCCCPPYGGGGVRDTCVACFGSPAPPLHVTDANASFVATWDSGGGFWAGSYTLTKSGVISYVPAVGGGCFVTYGAATISVGYTIRCFDGSFFGGGPVRVSVSRAWHYIDVETDINLASCDFGTPPRGQFFVDDSIPLGACCPSPGNPEISALSATMIPANCRPFSWSGSLTTGTAIPSDPAPGTVTVTT